MSWNIIAKRSPHLRNYAVSSLCPVRVLSLRTFMYWRKKLVLGFYDLDNPHSQTKCRKHKTSEMFSNIIQERRRNRTKYMCVYRNDNQAISVHLNGWLHMHVSAMKRYMYVVYVEYHATIYNIFQTNPPTLCGLLIVQTVRWRDSKVNHTLSTCWIIRKAYILHIE